MMGTAVDYSWLIDVTCSTYVNTTLLTLSFGCRCQSEQTSTVWIFWVWWCLPSSLESLYESWEKKERSSSSFSTPLMKPPWCWSPGSCGNWWVLILDKNSLKDLKLSFVTLSSLLCVPPPPLSSPQVRTHWYHVPRRWQDRGDGECGVALCQPGEIHSLLHCGTHHPWCLCPSCHLLCHHQEEPVHFPVGDFHSTGYSFWNKFKVMVTCCMCRYTEALGQRGAAAIILALMSP